MNAGETTTTGSVFLLGGGWNDVAYPQTYGRFAAAASKRGSARIACVLLEHADRETFYGWSRYAFEFVGITDTYPVFVSPDRPLLKSDVEGATGIFVAGGHTPGYHDAIVLQAREWLPALVRAGLPYAGISAGAMITAETAIVGGWTLPREHGDLVICSQELGEDEEHLDIRPGLGLVPFAVDAHASQYGSITRLMHAVWGGDVASGWAIDEETMIEVGPDGAFVSGLGSAYEVRKDGDALSVVIHQGTPERNRVP